MKVIEAQTKKFEKFDVLGEYLGKIVGPEIKCGHYLAALEDKEHEDIFRGLKMHQ